MIDYFIKKGGVEGYQIEALYADAQSKPDVAINEAVRLIEQEKVDMLLGFYSSAECVPAAARVEQLKKFMWITTCISSAVLEHRDLKYGFRAQPSGRRFRLLSMDFLAQNEDDKLKEALGRDVNHFFNVDPISIWLANEKSLRAPLPAMIKMVGEEYEKARPGTLVKSAHVGMAASNTYLFMSEVLPRAIKKYGGIDADALRKAALEVDLPEGGTMLGFGVKFEGEGAPMSGQNDRAFPVILQYVDDKPYLVWPKSQQQREPVLPLPGSSPYAAQ